MGEKASARWEAGRDPSKLLMPVRLPQGGVGGDGSALEPARLRDGREGQKEQRQLQRGEAARLPEVKALAAWATAEAQLTCGCSVA